jgi:hypothetical protein
MDRLHFATENSEARAINFERIGETLGIDAVNAG